MRITYFLLFFVASILTTSCNQTANNADKLNSEDTLIPKKEKSVTQKNENKPEAIASDNKKEEKIYDLIFALPEVKKEASFLEKETKGKRHLILLMYQTPEQTDGNGYWVKIGVDNGHAFSTRFNFFVSPDTFEIKYYDTLKDVIISLDAWRKESKNSNQK